MSYTYKYPRPSVTTDAILYTLNKGEIYILLIQRANPPFKDQWAFPGGFLEMDETLEAGCARELFEETGIENIRLKQFTTAGTPGRDPRGRTISVVYWAKTDRLLPLKSGDDARQAQWHALKKRPPLAFDHEVILNEFINEIIEKS